MKHIKGIKGITTDTIYLFETNYNVYDNDRLIKKADMIKVFNRLYFIDEVNTNMTEYITVIKAHKYDRVRKLKHTIIFTINNANNSYTYDIATYAID